MKFFLVGWICLGISEKECIRMGSEVVFQDYDECNQYYQTATAHLQTLNTVTLKFTCVQAGLLEDVL